MDSKTTLAELPIAVEGLRTVSGGDLARTGYKSRTNHCEAFSCKTAGIH